MALFCIIQWLPSKWRLLLFTYETLNLPLSRYSHYEPPGQNDSIVSQICLIFVSNCLKRSQFCLKHVSDKMLQFGLNLRPF